MLVAFVVCALAVGIPYWQVPYAQISMPDTLMAKGLVMVAIAALALRASGTSGLLGAMLVPAIAVPVVVLLRISADTAKDPTSHNLWPFEVGIALSVAFGAAAAGAILGWIVAKLVALARR